MSAREHFADLQLSIENLVKRGISDGTIHMSLEGKPGYDRDRVQALIDRQRNPKPAADDVAPPARETKSEPVGTAADIVMNAGWNEFYTAVVPIAARVSPDGGLVILEGEKRPVRLGDRGEVFVFSSTDECIHFLARLIQDAGHEFVRVTKEGNMPAAIPTSHMKSLIAKPDFLIVIKRVIRSAAAFQPSFTLPAPGIDQASGLCGAFEPRQVRRYTVQEALDIIEDISGELQFRTPADRANFLGACITAMIQDALGTARKPGMSINAASAESGKSVTMMMIICSREPQDAQIVIPTSRDGRTATTSVEELEKRIVAAARKRPALICVDNADAFAGSDFVEAMLTGNTFEARILGKSDSFVLPYVPFYIETKNRGSLRYKRSTLRRFLWITLEPSAALTGRRWKRPTLEDDLRDNVGGIRHRWQDALASLVWAWIDAGQPEFSGEQLNSFNRWSAVVGGILENAGITGFMDNREYQMQFVDPEYEASAAMIEIIYSLFMDTAFRAYDIWRDTDRVRTAFDARGLDLAEVLPDPSTRSWGRYLSTLVGKTGFKYRLRASLNREGVNVYCLDECGGGNA